MLFFKGIDIGNADALIKIGKSKNINEKEIIDVFSSDKEIMTLIKMIL